MANENATADRDLDEAQKQQRDQDAELGRNIRATAGDPVAQAAAQKIAAGDTDARLPQALELDQIDGQNAVIVTYNPHLDRFNCRDGGEVKSFTGKYAGLAAIRLDPKTGFTVAPIDKVREAVAADPTITK